jgi:tetratricopeptide (TPR) repeat protein
MAYIERVHDVSSQRSGAKSKAPRTKLRKVVPLLILFFLASGNLHAQSSGDPVARAAVLADQGNFREALTLLEPWLDSPARTTVDGTTGVAWNIRGLAQQNMGDFASARRSYENAIRILRNVPDQSSQYATTLDNYGTLMAEEGQLQESRSAHTRARQIYQSVGNHVGMARASTNLAVVSLGQGDRKRALQFLADAWSEESQVAAPDTADLAQIYATETVVRQKTGNSPGALDSINHAIQLLRQHYGEQYYLLAGGYALRANIEEKLRDRDAALADFRHSLELAQEANVGSSKIYFLIESSYAKALRGSGERNEAKRIESDAREGLEDLRQKSCSACSVSAAAFQ